MRNRRLGALGRAALLGMTMLAGLVPALTGTARAEDDLVAGATGLLPDGHFLTPFVAPGAQLFALKPGLSDFPSYVANVAMTNALSPDGKTLLVLSAGYNQLYDKAGAAIAADSNEYVFVYDVSSGTPRQTQVLQVPNTFIGLAFAPDGQSFYVPGGVDDNVHVFRKSGDTWAESGTPIALGHNKTGNGLVVKPMAAGIAVTADGKHAVIANNYNDSVSILDLTAGTKVGELDLRPGIINPAQSGKAGGEYPIWVAIRGTTAYVSAQRDREIDVVDFATPAAPTLVTRVRVPGNPNRMVVNRAGTRLFVAADNADAVFVVDTATNAVIETIHATAPEGLLTNPETFRGAATNSVALSRDGKTLYVTDGDINAVAVIPLSGPAPHHVQGLIPTAWYPNDVTPSADGEHLYVANGQSDPGPNPGNCSTNGYNAQRAAFCGSHNQYVLQIQKGGLLSMRTPEASALDSLTRQVAANDGFNTYPVPADERMMAALRARIHHVIYVVKENRTYDQILGDLGRGNGDPRLAEFGRAITPNFHRISRQFVDMDNFYDAGAVSGDGWPWSTSARESDIGIKTLPLNYSGRGLAYDWEGTNRNVDVAIPTLAGRQKAQPLYPNDPNLLPGTNNQAAPDGPAPGEGQRGYLWDSALRSGLSVRNYGFFIDLSRYSPSLPDRIPPVADPYAQKLQVAYAANPTLLPLTDIYYRGFDNNFPDFYRVQEWDREFTAYERSGTLPNLELVRLMHDHMGNFGTASFGIDTPEKQQADNDYAVGRLIDRVAHSRFKDDTLIFVLEDDAQDGADHVDARRSTAYIVGPYVKHHTVISTHYSTVNLLRTIEDILGIDHLSINDAYQRPMTDVFDLGQPMWNYEAVPSRALITASLPLPAQYARLAPIPSTHPASWWAEQTRGYDWSREDLNNAEAFNRLIWSGLKGGVPYPGDAAQGNASPDDEAREHADAAAPAHLALRADH